MKYQYREHKLQENKEQKENSVMINFMTGEETKGELHLADIGLEKCAAYLADKLADFMKRGGDANNFTTQDIFDDRRQNEKDSGNLREVQLLRAD